MKTVSLLLTLMLQTPMLVAKEYQVVWLSSLEAESEPERKNTIGKLTERKIGASAKISSTTIVHETGNPEKTIALIRNSKPNVIIPRNMTALRHVIAANLGVPIVFDVFGDPVSERLVKGWQQPGARVTGVVSSLSLEEKQLELLVRCAKPPGRIGFLLGPGVEADFVIPTELRAVASRFGTEVVAMRLETPADIADFRLRLKRERINAVQVTLSYWLRDHAQKIASALSREGLPSVGGADVFTNSGILFSVTARSEYRDSALADRLALVLRGRDAGTIPIDRPQSVRVLVNSAELRKQNRQCQAVLASEGDQFN